MKRRFLHVGAVVAVLSLLFALTVVNGTAPSASAQTTTPAPVSNKTTLTQGGGHTCAILENGTVKCWGYNNVGQLGDGTASPRWTPVSVAGLTNATAIAAGSAHSCALLEDGTVECWGSNLDGQLGDGTQDNRLTPVSVADLTNATAIATGTGNSCAVINDGTVKCWGNNQSGQLGNGTLTWEPGLTPVSVVGLTDVTAIAAGFSFACALLKYGTVKCWGNKDRVGDGDETNRKDRLTPVSVAGITNATAISAADGSACALLKDGTAKCWGHIAEDGLIPHYTPPRTTPVSVVGLTNATAISVGHEHACAVLEDDTAKCWGGGGAGQLGDDAIAESATPVPVVGLSNVTTVTAGERISCALRDDGTVKCWGGNNYLQPIGEIISGVRQPGGTQPGPGPTPDPGVLPNGVNYCDPAFTFLLGARGSGEAPKEDETGDFGTQPNGYEPPGTAPKWLLGGVAESEHPLYRSSNDSNRGMGSVLGATGRQLSSKLGESKVLPVGVAYRAIPVLDGKNPAVPVKFGLNYESSVNGGVENMVLAVQRIANYCSGKPSPQVILGGYSQGADVVDRALDKIQGGPLENVVTGVLMYGSPNFQHGAQENKSETNDSGLRALLRPLGSVAWIANHPGKAASFCRWGDIVCDPNASMVEPAIDPASGEVNFNAGIRPVQTQTAVKIHSNTQLGALPCPYTDDRRQFLWVCGSNAVLHMIDRTDLYNYANAGESTIGDPSVDWIYEAPPGQKLTITAVLGKLSQNATSAIVDGVRVSVTSTVGGLVKLPVWFRSTPAQVGEIAVENGVGTLEVTVPANTTAGLHHFVVYFPDGTTTAIPVQVNTALEVSDVSEVAVVTNATPDPPGSFPIPDPADPTGPGSPDSAPASSSLGSLGSTAPR